MRNSIGDYFNSHGLNDPLVPRLMIANFLFSPPGLLKINNASDYFPSWLFKVYVDLYEPSANAVSEVSTTQQNQDRSVPSNPAPQPDKINFGPFPDTLLDLTSNRLHLNRILGLSNLHYIDPDDEEIAIELCDVRSSLAVSILNCPESTLEQLWSTELGDRYWSLVRSGIQKRPLSESDASIKQNAVNQLNPTSGGGFGTPGALNSFLVAMMFFVPGSMKVDDAQNKIPNWLYVPYKSIFEDA